MTKTTTIKTDVEVKALSGWGVNTADPTSTLMSNVVPSGMGGGPNVAVAVRLARLRASTDDDVANAASLNDGDLTP